MDALTRTQTPKVPVAAAEHTAAAAGLATASTNVEAAVPEATHVPAAGRWAALQRRPGQPLLLAQAQTAAAHLQRRAVDVLGQLTLASAGLGLLGVAHAAPPARMDATAVSTAAGAVSQPGLLALEYSRERPAVLLAVIEEIWLRRGYHPHAEGPINDAAIEHLMNARRALTAQDPKGAWREVLHARNVMKTAPTEGQVRATLRAIQVSHGRTISQSGLGGQVDQATALAGSDVVAAARLTDEVDAAVGTAAYAHALQQSRGVAAPEGRKLPLEVTRLGRGAEAAYAQGDYVLAEAIVRELGRANGDAMRALINQPLERPSPTAMFITGLAFLGVGGAYKALQRRGDD